MKFFKLLIALSAVAFMGCTQGEGRFKGVPLNDSKLALANELTSNPWCLYQSEKEDSRYVKLEFLSNGSFEVGAFEKKGDEAAIIETGKWKITGDDTVVFFQSDEDQADRGSEEQSNKMYVKVERSPGKTKLKMADDSRDLEERMDNSFEACR